MVDRGNPAMTIQRQCDLLDVRRTSLYYSASANPRNKELMDRIDELFTEDPACGTRRLKAELRMRHGLEAGRGKIRSLMRRMGLHAIYRKPDTSKPNRQHKKYPYLLRGVKLVRPNQVWSTDITYVRLRGGFAYLCAEIDWYSRCVLSWRLSTTMETTFCVDALQEALARHGNPEIFNTDQGSQFTADEFTSVLLEREIRISMDGKGRALDNVYIERLWRTVKYDDIYIRGYETIRECRVGLAEYFDRYNTRRAHSSIEDHCPEEIYLGKVTLLEAA